MYKLRTAYMKSETTPEIFNNLEFRDYIIAKIPTVAYSMALNEFRPSALLYIFRDFNETSIITHRYFDTLGAAQSFKVKLEQLNIPELNIENIIEASLDDIINEDLPLVL